MFLRSQGESMHCAADGRFSGVLSSNNFIKSLASLDIFFNFGLSKSNYSLQTAFRIAVFDFPTKGGLPVSMACVMIPTLHISHFSSNEFFMTSGAM